MSTILNALYKETQNPAYNTVEPQNQSNRHWKAALFIALLVITALLATLLFMLLNPSQLAVQHNTQIEKAAQPKLDDTVLSAAESVQQKTVTGKAVSRVLFVTTPLTGPADEDFDARVQAVQPDNAAKEPALVAENATQPQQAAPEIDYSNVSAELQQRFEHALAVNTPQATRAFIESTDSDGSDIYQMSRDFQAQVPAISYDFHVYSSAAQERWVRINGEDLKEGQFDRSGNIQVLEIQPQRTLFRVGRQSFSLQSLTDWRK